MAAKKALVIGIDDYGGPPNDLACCVKDADAFARVLQTSYSFEEVHSLRDGNATLEKVDEELRWLFQARKHDDRVVLYFSGHGFTRTRDGIVEECLVLRNGLLNSERLLASASELPPGSCTAILDTSFSGSSEQFVADASRGAPEVEIAQAKVWRPTPDEAAQFDVAETEHKVTEFRRFACRPIKSAAGVVNALALRSQAYATAGGFRVDASSGSLPSGVADEGRLALSCVILCASLEGESAAASTSRTDGQSAFTHALISAIRQLGPQASTSEIAASTSARLRALGFRQTPRLVEQAGDLKLRRFITLEPISASESLRLMAEPRYWEGVLTAATPPLNSAWAVTQEVNPMTFQQPVTGAYQPLGAYQQPFGTTPLASDEVNRAITALGPALATVIPAIVPQIVNSVLAQQRSFPSAGYAPSLTPSFASPTPFGYPGLTPFGVPQLHQQATVEDVQRILPTLTPVLATVIPAVVPQIVNHILAQQRAMSVPWGSPYSAIDPWSGTPIGFQNPHPFAAGPFGRM